MEDINNNSSSITEDFFEAARTGSIEKFQEIEKCLIDRGLEFNPMVALAQLRNTKNETALFLACKHGQYDAVKYLVEHCQADVEQEGTFYFSNENNGQYLCRPLHVAVMSGDIYIVQYLIENCRADINAKTDTTYYSTLANDGGSTPLHLAVLCLNGYEQHHIISYLVQYGADMSTRNNDGNPAWALTRDPDVVRLLIRLGLNINETNEKHDSLMHIWSRWSMASEESVNLIHLLLERNCNLLANDDGLTPLQVAAIGCGGQPNHLAFKTIFESWRKSLSRIDKIEGLELIGATCFLHNDFNNGMIYWRKAMELRFNTPNRPPLHKCLTPHSHYARLAFENRSEVETPQELEFMAFHNAEALRIQALMTYCRLLRNDSWDIRYALTNHALTCWNMNNGQQFIDYSMLVLEYSHSIGTPLSYETVHTVRKLVMAFYKLNEEYSFERHLVNFNNIMPVLQRIAYELKRSQDEDSDQLKDWNADHMKNILLDCVVQLTILISSLPLTNNEVFEFKRCLYDIVSLKEQYCRNGYNLLLLACLPSSFTFCRDELDNVNEFGMMPSADAIRLFLELGIDPNSTDVMGNTSLHILAKNGHSYESPAIRILYEAGAHLDVINYEGQTMADLMIQNHTRQPNHIFVTPFEFPKLKCLAAHVVNKECIVSFSDLAPLGLFDFVLEH